MPFHKIKLGTKIINFTLFPCENFFLYANPSYLFYFLSIFNLSVLIFLSCSLNRQKHDNVVLTYSLREDFNLNIQKKSDIFLWYFVKNNQSHSQYYWKIFKNSEDWSLKSILQTWHAWVPTILIWFLISWVLKTIALNNNILYSYNNLNFV